MVMFAGLSMMWECCRHLQKAQTLDGSGPMRLGSSFRFQSSKNSVIVALALAQGVSAYLPGTLLAIESYLPLLGWWRCTLLQATAIATAMMKRNVPMLVTGSAV